MSDKCETHGIYMDATGKCEFCENERDPNRRKEVKIVGGGGKSGVKVLSKESRRGD